MYTHDHTHCKRVELSAVSNCTHIDMVNMLGSSRITTHERRAKVDFIERVDYVDD